MVSGWKQCVLFREDHLSGQGIKCTGKVGGKTVAVEKARPRWRNSEDFWPPVTYVSVQGLGNMKVF